MDKEDPARDRPTHNALRHALEVRERLGSRCFRQQALVHQAPLAGTWSAVVRRTTQPMILASHSERRHPQDNVFLKRGSLCCRASILVRRLLS